MERSIPWWTGNHNSSQFRWGPASSSIARVQVIKLTLQRVRVSHDIGNIKGFSFSPNQHESRSWPHVRADLARIRAWQSHVYVYRTCGERSKKMHPFVEICEGDTCKTGAETRRTNRKRLEAHTNEAAVLPVHMSRYPQQVCFWDAVLERWKRARLDRGLFHNNYTIACKY